MPKSFQEYFRCGSGFAPQMAAILLPYFREQATVQVGKRVHDGQEAIWELQSAHVEQGSKFGSVMSWQTLAVPLASKMSVILKNPDPQGEVFVNALYQGQPLSAKTADGGHRYGSKLEEQVANIVMVFPSFAEALLALDSYLADSNSEVADGTFE